MPFAPLALVPALPAAAAALIALRLVRGDAAVARTVVAALGATLLADLAAALAGADRLGAFAAGAIVAIAAIVAGYAARSLQGGTIPYSRFFALLAAATAGSLAVVAAGDLRALAGAWIVTGWLTSALLGLARNRPARRWALRHAAVEVVGDAAWLAILVLAGQTFGTFDLGAIAHAAAPGPGTTAIAVLLVVAGASRSALVPLHGWLPNSMEAPTPVSAFMHAGLVNGAGLLLAKTAALLVLAPAALALAALLGALTAALGTVCALVRPEAKRRLGWSTVAQMGFMVLQCGCGAFAGAVVHLVAHGGYKSAAFLGVQGSIAGHKRGRLLGAGAEPASGPALRALLAFAPALAGLALAWFVLRGALVAADVVPAIALAWASAVSAARLAAERPLPPPRRALVCAAVAGALAAYAIAVVSLDAWLGNALPHVTFAPAAFAVTAGAIVAGLIAGCGVRLRPPDALYAYALTA
jgi:NADH:ubiquinone oxidoreductase subunit 5 (subunit L)/multisubunit Na+/H+ antiporter MnhA subunit